MHILILHHQFADWPYQQTLTTTHPALFCTVKCQIFQQLYHYHPLCQSAQTAMNFIANSMGKLTRKRTTKTQEYQLEQILPIWGYASAHAKLFRLPYRRKIFIGITIHYFAKDKLAKFEFCLLSEFHKTFNDTRYLYT